jgi:hypothetical protein
MNIMLKLHEFTAYIFSGMKLLLAIVLIFITGIVDAVHWLFCRRSKLPLHAVVKSYDNKPKVVIPCHLYLKAGIIACKDRLERPDGDREVVNFINYMDENMVDLVSKGRDSSV